MTQEELAMRAGTKQPAIARFESGRADPRLSTIVTIVRALDATFRLDIAPREALESGFQMVQWWHRPGHSEPWKSVHDQHLVAISDRNVPSGAYHIFNTHPVGVGTMPRIAPCTPMSTVSASQDSFLKMLEAESFGCPRDL